MEKLLGKKYVADVRTPSTGAAGLIPAVLAARPG
jgi:hypothetical protein